MRMKAPATRTSRARTARKASCPAMIRPRWTALDDDISALDDDVGHEPRGVARNERVVLADSDAGRQIADHPAADERVATGKSGQRVERLPDIRVIGIGSALGDARAVAGHDLDVRTFARAERLADPAGRQRRGGRL